MNRIKTIFLASMLGFCTLVPAQLQKIKQMIPVAENTKETQAKEIILNSQFCKVDVRKAENETTTIQGKLEAMEEHEGYKVLLDEQGASITAGIEVPSEAKVSYAGEFTVFLAQGTTLKINTGSGNITINDINDCNIDINSAKGKVNATNVNGNFKVLTKSGNITINNFDGNFNLESSLGQINLTDGKGNINFETSDGATTATNIQGTIKGKTIAGTQTYLNINGDLTILGSTGALKISESEGIFRGQLKGAPLNLFKVKGEFHIDSEKGAIISAASSNAVTLTASSDFTTTEGKINITLTNKKDELTFDLEHSQKGDIGLIAKGERTSKKTLKVGNGPIVVTGRTRTGTQTFK